MRLRTDQRTIDDVKLYTTSLPVMRSARLWARLGRIAAPALVHLRSLPPNKIIAALVRMRDLKDLDLAVAGDIVSMLGPGVADMFRELEPHVEEIAVELLVSTVAISDGQKYELTNLDAINAAFGDRFATFVKTLWWVGRHNFGNFSGGGRASAASTPEPAPLSTSPT